MIHIIIESFSLDCGLFVTIGQIPNLDWIDLESWSFFGPSSSPLSLAVIEFRRWSWGFVWPRLVSNSIREISCSASNCQVKNDIEILIERSSLVGGGFPRILSSWQSCFFPERFIFSVDLENSIWIIVQVCVKLILIPIKTKSMEIIIECSWA